MKTFIFTYDRFKTITTSFYLKDKPHIVLCHDNEQKQKFIDAGRCFGQIIATGQQKGLSFNRNYALEMMEDGEWACFWVDDLIKVTFLKNYWEINNQKSIDINTLNQKFYIQQFNQECNADMFYKIAIDTVNVAEKKGYALCGFSLTGNPFFRKNHYSYWSLADGRCWLIKKTKLRFDVNAQVIDDYCFTALNLKEFGGVVNNNWLLPLCERYKPGGYGSINERLSQKIKECKYLVETYPQYICYANKKGWEPFSHIKIRQKKINNKQLTLF